jgi:hypothetical protein
MAKQDSKMPLLLPRLLSTEKLVEESSSSYFWGRQKGCGTPAG